MKNTMQSIKIVLMFVLLLSVVCIPLLYIEYHNNHLLNEISVSPVQTAELNDPNIAMENYNIWDRIGIMINEPIGVRTRTFTDSPNDYLTNEAESELLQTMEEQLMIVYEHNSLPELTFSEIVQVSIFKDTYMIMSSSQGYTNVLDSELSISVWAIEAEYQDFNINVYMDTETSALYYITISSKNTNFIYQPEISAKGFFEYLKTFSDIPNENEEIFSASSVYSERKIALYLTSVNKNTEQIHHIFFPTSK